MQQQQRRTFAPFAEPSRVVTQMGKALMAIFDIAKRATIGFPALREPHRPLAFIRPIDDVLLVRIALIVPILDAILPQSSAAA